jgi:DNA-binding CsgD family transcriptional regulator
VAGDFTHGTGPLRFSWAVDKVELKAGMPCDAGTSSPASCRLSPHGASWRLWPEAPGYRWRLAPQSTVAPLALPGLTAREREILSYLVAGSTYAEIANTLVISEKTVSSHVSNLLRKTHTSSRVELAQLAHRVEQIEPSI